MKNVRMESAYFMLVLPCLFCLHKAATMQMGVTPILMSTRQVHIKTTQTELPQVDLEPATLCSLRYSYTRHLRRQGLKAAVQHMDSFTGLTGPGVQITLMPVEGGGCLILNRHGSIPMFLSTRDLAYERPSCMVPKSRLCGIASSPLTTPLPTPIVEQVLTFLRVASSTWNSKTNID